VGAGDLGFVFAQGEKAGEVMVSGGLGLEAEERLDMGPGLLVALQIEILNRGEVMSRRAVGFGVQQKIDVRLHADRTIARGVGPGDLAMCLRIVRIDGKTLAGELDQAIPMARFSQLSQPRWGRLSSVVLAHRTIWNR
jgi:hypothetical protein